MKRKSIFIKKTYKVYKKNNGEEWIERVWNASSPSKKLEFGGYVGHNMRKWFTFHDEEKRMRVLAHRLGLKFTGNTIHDIKLRSDLLAMVHYGLRQDILDEWKFNKVIIKKKHV